MARRTAGKPVAAIVMAALLAGIGGAEARQLTNEECRTLRTTEGARGYRPITGEADPAEHSAALRATWGLGERAAKIPAECRDRPVSEEEPAITPAPVPERPTTTNGSMRGARCTTKQFERGSVAVCE